MHGEPEVIKRGVFVGVVVLVRAQGSAAHRVLFSPFFSHLLLLLLMLISMIHGNIIKKKKKATYGH